MPAQFSSTPVSSLAEGACPEVSVAALDRGFLWHPFTQMQDWCGSDPLVIVEGRGASLRDEQGRWYLDGNSSIWTNLHGHRNARLDAALKRQLERFAHSSFLGLTHEPAAALAAALCALWPPNTLERVFFLRQRFHRNRGGT